MTNHLEIEKTDEIRCSYCLQWNNRNTELCWECTAPLITPVDFGAARALTNWERCDPRQLDNYIRKEKQSRINNWNDLFQQQLDQILKITKEFKYIEPKLILDIKDDVEKEILKELPKNPEGFKIYQDYTLPDPDLNEIGKLKYVFRSHPIEDYKALSAIALVHFGGADNNVFDFLVKWKPRTNKMHQERLLSFAHWSLKFNYPNFNHQYNIDDILPLYNGVGEASKWARLYLYMGNYNTSELKFDLEESAARGSFHLALSCAAALRDYDKIRKLVIDNIDEGTLSIALRYSNEDFVPYLIKYLKYAPRYQQELIIRRLSSLRLTQSSNIKKVMEWLFAQSRDEYFELVFRWEDIPQFQKVIDRLLQSPEGLQVLETNLAEWINNRNESKEMPSWILDKVFSTSVKGKSADARKLLASLKERVFEKYYYKQCKVTINNATPAQIKKLTHFLFQKQPVELSDHQITSGLLALQKIAKERDTNGKLYFNLTDKSLSDYCGSPDNFLKTIKRFIANSDINSSACDWLEVLFYELATAQVKYKENKETLSKLFQLMISSIMQDRLRPHLRTRFLNFVKSRYHLIDEPKKFNNKLKKILNIHTDHDTKYWVMKIISDE